MTTETSGADADTAYRATKTIYGVNVSESLILGQFGDRLEVTADVGDMDVTITLNRFHVRELRLALARIERDLP